MDQDTELFRQLIETFQVELEENLQHITQALLQLEKGNLGSEDSKNLIDLIFRCAHNIKGTSRSLGINPVSEIAHQLESLFLAVQSNTSALTPRSVDLCLEGVDAMRSAMQAFVAKKALNFDLEELIHRIQSGSQTNSEPPPPKTTGLAPKKVEHAKSLEESDTIRVSLNKLDRISALMEEMQIGKIAIDDHYLELARAAIKAKQLHNDWTQTLLTLKSQMPIQAGESLQKALGSNSDFIADLADSLNQMQRTMRPHINELSILNNSLQEEMRMLRLVPAANLTGNLPRAVRDLAQELDKKVDFEIRGDEVKVDKIILEGLKNPLLHLLRNAIDHGIGNQAERLAKGKNGVGKISLEIQQEDNQIVFIVKDDGKGIDTQKVAQLALSKGLISKTELEALKQEELLNLIFHPGFSTKETVTEVSGRGVGLDVVKSSLESLKGHIRVETTLGQGTTFTLRLPLTLVSERGLMVNSGGHLFALPTSGIERVLTLQSEQIINLEANQAIKLDEHPVPLRALSDLLKLEKTEPALPGRLFIVVIHKGWQLMALLVEDIIGEKEIVIKPLQSPLARVPCVAGGTLSGNGQVIIVLNPNDLISQALQLPSTARLRFQPDKHEASTRPHILVVDDSITTRTLEKNVLESKDYQVTVAVNGKEAWDILQKQKFSLLITDVSMPIMDGFTLTERVKQNPELKDLPVIIVTSLGSETEKKRGIEVGANAYIVKSEFESSRLLEIIAQLV